MDIEEIRAIVREEFASDECIACIPEMRTILDLPELPVTMIDTFGIRWCREHQFRGEFVNLMALRSYQEVLDAPFQIEDENGQEIVKYYSIGASAWLTAQIAMNGEENAIVALALKIMEDQQESEGVA